MSLQVPAAGTETTRAKRTGEAHPLLLFKFSTVQLKPEISTRQKPSSSRDTVDGPVLLQPPKKSNYHRKKAEVAEHFAGISSL